mmetsp:Transcript_3526/g.12322  ORF Transcript_3526/g.12322 Transcript_3526/m.12322 type:complete len:102 (-) Transcript_3526:3208-3513(-)
MRSQHGPAFDVCHLSSKTRAAAYLNLIADSLHVCNMQHALAALPLMLVQNFTDGLALGITFVQGDRKSISELADHLGAGSGITTAVAIFFHEVQQIIRGRP